MLSLGDLSLTPAEQARGGNRAAEVEADAAGRGLQRRDGGDLAPLFLRSVHSARQTAWEGWAVPFALATLPFQGCARGLVSAGKGGPRVFRLQ